MAQNRACLQSNVKAPTTPKILPKAFQVATRRTRSRAAECTVQSLSSEASAQQSRGLKGEGCTVEQINDVLPQTQCGLCTYDGCKPYAEAIVHDNENINRCPPGGIRGLKELAELTGADPTPLIKTMQTEEKPRMLAVVREDECIGCTKCIQACPVDAILGATKLMHTVIGDECTGCELCVEPCPVDCIDMIEIGHIDDLSDKAFKQRSNQYRTRYESREARLARDTKENRKKHRAAKQANAASKTESLAERKREIVEAIARSKARRAQ